MKVIIIILAISLSISGFAQTKARSYKKTTTTKKSKTVATKPTPGKPATTSVKSRIEQRLKDSAAAGTQATQTQSVEVVNGIQVITNTTGAANSAQSSSTTGINNSAPLMSDNRPLTNSSGQTILSRTPVNGNASAGTIISSNPTANKPVTNEQSQYNTTDINRNQMNAINQDQNASAAQNPATKTWGQNTIGEAQWGQNQVGENQWTPPTLITTNFTNDFPAIRGAMWSRDNNMNTFSARYRSGDWWTTSTYNAQGIRTETRIEYPITGIMPEPVTIYRSKQNLPTDFTRISKVERPGKTDVYEVRLTSGQLVYLDSNGTITSF